jgi:hypothetical protein
VSSILKDVKQTLGIDRDDRSFDVDICLHINSALSEIRQIGLPIEPRCADDTLEWEMLYVGTNLDMVREIVVLHCKLAFDPASYSFVNAAYEKLLEESKTRLAYELEVS